MKSVLRVCHQSFTKVLEKGGFLRGKTVIFFISIRPSWLSAQCKVPSILAILGLIPRTDFIVQDSRGLSIELATLGVANDKA